MVNNLKRGEVLPQRENKYLRVLDSLRKKLKTYVMHKEKEQLSLKIKEKGNKKKYGLVSIETNTVLEINRMAHIAKGKNIFTTIIILMIPQTILIMEILNNG